MLYLAAVLVVAATILFTLLIRSKDIPPPEPVSPTKHLEERRASIYENLRDLQFEYRVGKLSDADYQRTKLTLQQELAGVLAKSSAWANNQRRSTRQRDPSPLPAWSARTAGRNFPSR